MEESYKLATQTDLSEIKKNRATILAADREIDNQVIKLLNAKAGGRHKTHCKTHCKARSRSRSKSKPRPRRK